MQEVKKFRRYKNYTTKLGLLYFILKNEELNEVLLSYELYVK